MRTLQTVLLVLGGLAAGLAVSFWLQSAPQPTAAEPAPAARAPPAARPDALDAAAAARLAAVEDALDAEILQRAALEERVAELAAQLEALGEQPRLARAAAAAGPSADAPTGPREARPLRRNAEQAERRFVERLVAEGFAPDRAEWLTRRVEELRMAALQAQYDAQRGGRPVEPRANAQTLRAELGDADYERYLRADGRPTAVPVRDVLASSPAERSGLQAGDEIVAYAGQRVYDMRELNMLTLQGTPGESVVVDVRRGGQTVQLVMPRGPLGIFGGGFRGP